MKTISRFSIVMLTALIFYSCTKNDSVQVDNRRSMLMNKQWKMTATISIDSNNNETDLYTGLPEYRKDDYFIFNADSTYELNDNVLLSADTISSIIDAGTWALTENGNRLELYSNFFNVTYEPAMIRVLTNDELYIERIYPSDRSKIRTWYRSR